MREIEFRLWDKKYGCMDDYGFYIGSDGRVFQPASMTYNTPNTEIEEVKDRYILMQYTGLKDKNGVKIFEGDIVEITDGDEWVVGRKIARMDGETLNWHPQTIGKIIGNIHENPEMV